jgi:phosphinothricin acetyltransferase
MISIRPMLAEDWTRVAEIYREGLRTGVATLEEEVPAFGKWDAAHAKNCRLVCVVDGEVAGWAALAPVSARRVYAGVAEISVYVGEKFRGQKVGETLLKALCAESEKEGYWTLQSSVLEENAPSVALHHKCGFRTVGVRERIGRARGKWHNTLLMERRIPGD